MKMHRRLLYVSLAALTMSPLAGSADGLPRHAYLRAVGTIIKPGQDVRASSDDTANAFGLVGSYPVLKTVSVRAGVQRVMASGSYDGTEMDRTTDSILAGLMFHTDSATRDPFVQVAAYHVESEMDPTPAGSDSKTSDMGYVLTGGIDLSFADSFVFTPSFMYVNVGDANSKTVRGAILVWLTEHIAADVTIGYELDNETITYAVALTATL